MASQNCEDNYEHSFTDKDFLKTDLEELLAMTTTAKNSNSAEGSSIQGKWKISMVVETACTSISELADFIGSYCAVFLWRIQKGTQEGKKSWPELVGVQVTVAKKTIKRENPFVNIVIVPSGYGITCDYRRDRVRVFVDKNDIVYRVPGIG